MAAKCRLLSFIIVIPTITLFCLIADWEVGMSEFQKGYHREVSVILQAEDRSKVQVISSDNDWLFLVLYAEHSPSEGLRHTPILIFSSIFALPFVI